MLISRWWTQIVGVLTRLLGTSRISRGPEFGHFGWRGHRTRFGSVIQLLEVRAVLDGGGVGSTVLSLAGSELTLADVSAVDNDNAFTVTRIGATTIQITDASGTPMSTGLLGDPIAGVNITGSTATIDASVLPLSLIRINAAGGNDSLIVDSSGGSVGVTLRYDGGTAAAGDTLNLTGGSPGTVFLASTSLTDGSVEASGGLNHLVNYLNIESITDSLTSGSKVVTYGNSFDSVSVTDGTPNDGRTSISSSSGVPVSFVNPASGLTINGGFGDDTITVASVDSGLKAAIQFNGNNGADTLNINTTLTLGSGASTGNLTAFLENININQAVNTTAGTVGSVNLNATGVLKTLAAADINAGGVVTLIGQSQFDMAGDVSTSSDHVQIHGPVNLKADLSISTLGGDVTFNHTVNDDGSVSNQNVVIQAGTGSVSIVGAVGGTTPLQSLAISGSTISAGNVATAVSLSVTNTSASTISGVISGAGTLSKSGTGTLILAGNNSYSGTTSINAGTLQVNGTQTTASSVVTVFGNAILAGSGSVNRPVSVQANGSVSPGVSPGILGTGNLSLVSDSNFSVELNGTAGGTQYDQVNVNGTVSLGGSNLVISVGYIPANGDSFTILSNDGTDTVTGTFKVGGISVPDGGAFVQGGNRYVIDYTAGSNSNDVTITVANNAPPSAVNLSSPAVTLPEDTSTVAATILSDITVVDDGQGTNALSLSGADAGFFEIIAGQLLLRAGVALDFETRTSYSVDVRVDDSSVGGSPDAVATFTLTISNINEQPTDIALSGTTVAENQPVGTTVGILSSSDPEGGPFIYSLVPGTGGDDNGSFQISGSSLQTNAVFNYELKNSYSVRIRSEDAGGQFREEVFAIEILNQTEVLGIDVQVGQSQRSFVQYLDVLFDRPDDLNSLVASLGTAFQLTKLGLSGTAPVLQPLAGIGASIVGNSVRLDFGAQGLGGSRNTNTADGYYEIAVNTDLAAGFESTQVFHRLLGDITGDGNVDAADRNKLLAGSGAVAERDVNGDGGVNLTDTSLLNRALGRKLLGSLVRND